MQLTCDCCYIVHLYHCLGLACCNEDTIAFTNCSCQTLYTLLPMKALNMLVRCTWYMHFLKLKILPDFGVYSSRILANFLKVSEIPFAHY